MDATSTDYTSTPKRVILGNLNNQSTESPISPMANLKLLIKVATSHDSSMSENSSEVVVTPPHCLPEKKVKNKYMRQLRSLGFICTKFLQLYSLDLPPGKHQQISLGNLAQVLEIEKRRVYDIINVVASLNMATKVRKDIYVWYGKQFLPPLLCKLKMYALQNNLDQLLERVESTGEHTLTRYCRGVIASFLQEGTCVTSINATTSASDQPVEDNRIGILCQKFIMLFLITPEGRALNLSLVSKVILPRDIQDKTGMRRLYDIANVLESLGLIRKHTVKTFRKPSFIYCGPAISDSSVPEPEYKLNDMLEVVCTELEKFSNSPVSLMPPPSAKKQLFSEPRDEIKIEGKPVKRDSEFIKAPEHSFILLRNTITKKNINSDTETSVEPPSKYPRITLANFKKDNLPTIKLNRIAHPVTIIKPIRLSAPKLQNGGIYKAVKSGDVIQLVKL